MIAYPILGLSVSSVACNTRGIETNCGGIMRTSMFTLAETLMPFTSKNVYVNVSLP